jgi:hypothetical protein
VLTCWELAHKTTLCANAKNYAENVTEWLQKNEASDLYFGLALRHPDFQGPGRGKKTDCSIITAFALDIDLATGTHAADNLPHTDEDVEAILSIGPTPSALVLTGGGYHAYWFLTEPLLADENTESLIQAFQAKYIHHALTFGWHVDQTHTVDRVWRIPGSYNHKQQQESHLLLHSSNPRYTVTELGIPDYTPKLASSPKKASLPDTPYQAPTGTEIPSSTFEVLHNLQDPEKRELIGLVLEGESFAKPGSRDAALHKVCSIIAFADGLQTAPEVLAEILRPSLTIWAAEKKASKSIDDEMFKALEKMQRAQRDLHKVKCQEQASLAAVTSAIGTVASITHPAQVNSLSEKHFVLQQDTHFHVFDFTKKRYAPVCSRSELPIVLRDAWPNLDYSDKVSETLNQYATRVVDVRYSLVSNETLFEPEESVLHIPCAGKRTLAPKFHAKIDAWLRLIPANQAELEPFLNWIAAVPMSAYQCAALYLAGAKSIGKTLLANGLSKIWKVGPTNFDHAVSRFNDSILNCPLVYLDESSVNQQLNLCATVRRLIGNSSHQVERKGLPIVSVDGALRILITANDNEALNVKGNGELTEDAKKATAERILHITVNPEAGVYLESQPDRDDWQAKNMIAEHALWLNEQRGEALLEKIRGGQRFLVKGIYKSDFHDSIGTRQEETYAVTEWLIHALLNPTPKLLQPAPSFYVRNGHVRVVSRIVLDTWEHYLKQRYYMPSNPANIGRILKTMSRLQRRISDIRLLKCYEIPVEFLSEQAETLEICTADQILQAAKNPKFVLENDGEDLVD